MSAEIKRWQDRYDRSAFLRQDQQDAAMSAMKAEIAELRAALAVKQQVVEYEQRHAAELEVALAEVHSAAQAAATAQPRPTDDQLWDQTIRDRDAYHDWADKLAEAIAAYFGGDIGEHSNMNLPWSEALDLIPPAVRPEPIEGQSELSKGVLDAMYRAFQRGDSVERVHATVMALLPPAAQQVGAALDRPAVAGQTDCYCGGWDDVTGRYHQGGCPEADAPQPSAQPAPMAWIDFASTGEARIWFGNEQSAKRAAGTSDLTPVQIGESAELVAARAEIVRLETMVKLADALRNKEKGN